MASTMPVPETLEKLDMYIDGAFVEPASGEYFESFDPFTARPWALVARGNAEDADRAVQAAHRAFQSAEWRGMHPSQRGALLRRLADLVAENAERLGELEVRDNGKLRGFSFCTLERIGGTPCVLIGAGHTCRTTRRATVLRGIVTDQLRRAALSFPDEDVLVGMQINDPGAFEAFKNLHDVVPRSGHKATGEERAWGRRLAKRFGIGSLSYEDRIFTTRGKSGPPVVLDHASLKPQQIRTETAALLDGLRPWTRNPKDPAP